MTKPAKKTAKENLDEMLKRIRKENEALQRLIEALKCIPGKPGTFEKKKIQTNKSN